MSVTQTLFMQEPGDTSVISINDVNQGWLGDCSVCAPIAALALQHPDYVKNMIRDNGNGTESVRLFLGTSYFSNSSAPRLPVAADNSTWITVHNSDLGRGMNTNNGGQLIVNGLQEIWPQVIENAIAQVSGGYDILNYGGFPGPIMSLLTGLPFTGSLLDNQLNGAPKPSAAQLRGDLASGDIITFTTMSPNGYGLVYNHVYTLTSVDNLNGTDFAYFRNPWGYGNPSPVPVSDLGGAFSSMDVGVVPGSTESVVVTPPNPLVKTLTGNRDGGVTLRGTAEAGDTITITDVAMGHVTTVGSTTVASNGIWSLDSHAMVNTSTVNTFSVSVKNSAGVSSATSSALFLTSTGADTFTATPGVSEVFSIMSFRGSDIINGFETTAVVGAAHDVINFSGRGITSFSQVQSMMSGAGSTVLSIGSGKTVTLSDVAPTSLTAADFRYS